MKNAALEYRKQTGSNIRCIRAMHGYTQKLVAAHLQMSIANLSNIENGYTTIDGFKLKQLAGFFNLKETDIIEFHLQQPGIAKKVS